MPNFDYIIFDIDDTLLDFYSAFLAARKKTSDLLGVECSDEFGETDERCGWRAWQECRLDDTGDEEIQKNYHELYYQYVTLRYRYLLGELHLGGEVEKLSECYFNALCESKFTKEPCTLEVYKSLSENYRLVLATNGISDMQKQRTADFLPYTHRIFISEDIGTIKPAPAFFEYMLNELKCSPERCLMVGDSLANDIIGAKNVGMSVCWYNPKNKPAPENVSCDFVIGSIYELRTIV